MDYIIRQEVHVGPEQSGVVAVPAQCLGQAGAVIVIGLTTLWCRKWFTTSRITALHRILCDTASVIELETRIVVIVGVGH